MIITSDQLQSMKVMSLHIGGEIASTQELVVSPETLQVIAFKVTSKQLGTQEVRFLRLEEVRELSNIGLIVDSIEDLTQYGDVAKLDEIYDLHFNPIGMNVVDEKNHKIGKVIHFTVESSSFVIQQLAVKLPLLKRMNETELLIHRTQIIEINNHAIVVHSQAKAPEVSAKKSPGAYVNPFRASNTAPLPIDRSKD